MRVGLIHAAPRWIVELPNDATLVMRQLRQSRASRWSPSWLWR